MTRILALSLASSSIVPAHAQTARFTAITGGKNVGQLWVGTQGTRTTVDYDIKNNGHGPTIVKTITTGPNGVPMSWSVTDATTFGSKVSERFTRQGRSRGVG